MQLCAVQLSLHELPRMTPMLLCVSAACYRDLPRPELLSYSEGAQPKSKPKATKGGKRGSAGGKAAAAKAAAAKTAAKAAAAASAKDAEEDDGDDDGEGKEVRSRCTSQDCNRKVAASTCLLLGRGCVVAQFHPAAVLGKSGWTVSCTEAYLPTAASTNQMLMQSQRQRNQLGLPAHLPPMPTPLPPLPAADAMPADPTRPSAAEEQLYENYFDVRRAAY